MKHTLFISILFIIATSCTIQQHVHFNEDWSGTMVYHIDFSRTMSIMDDEASSDSSNFNFMDNEDFQNGIKELEDIEGIRNVKMEEKDDYNYFISLEFADLQALNTTMTGSNATMGIGSDDESFQYFQIKKNKLTYAMPNEVKEMAEDDDGTMEMMSSSIDFQIKFSFEKGIKKIKSDNSATIGYDQRSITWQPDLSQLLKGELATKMEITLEK